LARPNESPALREIKCLSLAAKPWSAAGRKRQAERLVSELERRCGANPQAIILVGDFDHTDSEALEPIRDGSLRFNFKRDRRGEVLARRKWLVV
jgi:endonuclease/exonuclease/phosphatase family metal-dependent hydrolase